MEVVVLSTDCRFRFSFADLNWESLVLGRASAAVCGHTVDLDAETAAVEVRPGCGNRRAIEFARIQ